MHSPGKNKTSFLHARQGSHIKYSIFMLIFNHCGFRMCSTRMLKLINLGILGNGCNVSEKNFVAYMGS